MHSFIPDVEKVGCGFTASAAGAATAGVGLGLFTDYHQ